MATLAQWLDVETEVERVFVSYLGTTLNLPALGSDSNTSVTTPRIEVVSVVEEMGPHQFAIPSGTYAGRRLYDQFRVAVHVDLVYSPYWNALQVTQPNTAAALRGQLRSALSDWRGLQAIFTTGGLLNIAADSLRQTAGNRSIDAQEKEETLTTTVSAVIFLNTNVVPT